MLDLLTANAIDIGLFNVAMKQFKVRYDAISVYPEPAGEESNPSLRSGRTGNEVGQREALAHAQGEREMKSANARRSGTLRVNGK